MCKTESKQKSSKNCKNRKRTLWPSLTVSFEWEPRIETNLIERSRMYPFAKERSVCINNYLKSFKVCSWGRWLGLGGFCLFWMQVVLGITCSGYPGKPPPSPPPSSCSSPWPPAGRLKHTKHAKLNSNLNNGKSFWQKYQKKKKQILDLSAKWRGDTQTWHLFKGICYIWLSSTFFIIQQVFLLERVGENYD